MLPNLDNYKSDIIFFENALLNEDPIDVINEYIELNMLSKMNKRPTTAYNRSSKS